MTQRLNKFGHIASVTASLLLTVVFFVLMIAGIYYGRDGYLNVTDIAATYAAFTGAAAIVTALLALFFKRAAHDQIGRLKQV